MVVRMNKLIVAYCCRHLVGVALVSQMMSQFARGQVSLTDLVRKGLNRTYKEVSNIYCH